MTEPSSYEQLAAGVPPIPTAEEFVGKVALVTGGTEGLGKNVALALTRMGCDVFVCGRREAMGAAFEQEAGPKGHYIRCDLQEPDQVDAMVQQAGKFKGHIDYLVNNAAIDPNIPFDQMTLEQFEQIYQIDLRPFFLVTKAALPYMQKGAGKAIVNMGTTNYMKGIPGMSGYNAAKSGIVGFTRSLARDLAGSSDIRVNIVSPGWTLTERQTRDHIGGPQKQYLLESQAIKRLMYPGHITPAVLFFLSKAAAGITGQNLVADGGQFMQ